jgi:phage terminase large subunit-like protein
VKVVDYDLVVRDIVKLSKIYNFREIALDRGFQGASTATALFKHFGENKVIAVPQGILTLNAPFRELLELLKLKRIHHDGNPVLRWMASNTSAEQRGGLIKPSKDTSSEKIDGITALTMCPSRAILQKPKRSAAVY